MKLTKKTILSIAIVIIGLMLIISLAPTFTVINAGFIRRNAWADSSSFKWPNKGYNNSFKWHLSIFMDTNAFHIRKGPMRWNQSWFGNLTINSEQAKTLVDKTIYNLKIGTVISFKTGWVIPVEDEEGIITLIYVSKINAPTAEYAKMIVEESLNRGWRAGEPKLVRCIYYVPLLDTNNVHIAYVKVDGGTGEIIRKPTTILGISKDQAKTIVSNAIKEFKISEVKERNSLWIVSIEYKGKVVMIVPLGKLNAPSSEDVLKAVQESLKNGWSVGEPKELQFIYDVPIIDTNNNIIGSVKVDGRSGEIIAETRMPIEPSAFM
ncbi:MAG: hypothetical protein QW589_05705 [Candidatus Bathyarchaeia archaeon]